MVDGLAAIKYWEYVTISYLICAVVLIGLIVMILIDGIRQKKLLNELENQEKDSSVGSSSELELNQTND